MKKYKIAVLFVVCVILLAAVDQCAKLVIDRCYEADDEALMQVRDCFHIHHRIHTSTLFDDIIGSGRAYEAQVAFAVLAAALACGALGFIHKASVFAGLKNRKKLLFVIMLLITATLAIRLIDYLYWGGTHDFICLSTSHFDADGNLKIMHLSGDINDIYLYLALVLGAVYLVLIIIGWIKLIKDKDAYAELKKRQRRKHTDIPGFDE